VSKKRPREEKMLHLVQAIFEDTCLVTRRKGGSRREGPVKTPTSGSLWKPPGLILGKKALKKEDAYGGERKRFVKPTINSRRGNVSKKIFIGGETSGTGWPRWTLEKNARRNRGASNEMYLHEKGTSVLTLKGTGRPSR